MYEQAEQTSLFDPDLWSGKTSPEPLAPTKAKTSASSSKKRRGSSIKLPLFLALRKESGLTREPLWETDGVSLGEFLTHSFGESPSVAVESHLSQILQENPHPRYSLSAKACQGILRRAERCGKQLPEILKMALEQQITKAEKIFDARGNGNGCICPTLTGGHESRITDYTAIVCMATQQGGAEIRTDGKAPTLTAAAGMSGNNQPVNASVVYAIDRAAFNQGENAKYDFEISDSGINSTLVGREPSAVAYAIGNGQAAQTGLHEKTHALDCMHDQQAVMYAKPIKDIIKWIVRRLTPLECERLQGFPDGWTDIGEWVDGKGKKRKTTDSARYKALGNSIAIPPWTWILQRLSIACGEDKTMASLFDGIGGFPLIWERINGAGNCLWTSEIDEFCIAVTERRYGNEADNI